MTSASYGIPTQDGEKEFLEKILQSTVMQVPEPPPVPITVPAKDYADAVKQIDAIRTAMDRLVSRAVLLHDKTAASGERVSDAFLSFSLVPAGDLMFTATLNEDEANIDAVKQMWEMFGVADMQVEHPGPHSYVLSGKRAGLDTSFEIECAFDPATGSLRIVDTDGGEVVELFEFVPLARINSRSRRALRGRLSHTATERSSRFCSRRTNLKGIGLQRRHGRDLSKRRRRGRFVGLGGRRGDV